MQGIYLSDIGINNDVIRVKTGSYWYCLTRIRVVVSQICQAILDQDYSLGLGLRPHIITYFQGTFHLSRDNAVSQGIFSA